MKLRGLHGDRPVLAAAGILGALFYWFRFGLGFLDPRRIDWLLGTGDTAFHQLAWTFFRYDSWHWPPGVVKTYMAPGGTTIGVTDSLPLLAFPFKVLSFLLPATFQYAGLWLLINHVLMGVFAVLVTGLFFRPLLPRFLAAGILVLCPAWLIRDGHFALSAHWVYLAALWLYLKPAPAEGGRPCLAWWLLLGVAAWIHPYPTTFVFGFLVADQGRRWFVKREISPPRALITLGVGIAVLLAMWSLAGFLRIGHLPINNLSGDRLWQAGFHALWNSQGRTLLLPGLPLGNRDAFEGFVYLGAGGLLAALAALVLGGGRQLGPRFSRHWSLMVMLCVFGLYAFSPRTELGDQLYRAQARFLWPYFYVVVVAGLATVARWGRPRSSLALVAVIFVVQAIDLAPLFDRKTEYDAHRFVSRLQDPQWEKALASADLLLATPSTTATTVFKDDFIDLTILAHQADVPTTAGFAARSYLGEIMAVKELTRTFLFGGNPDPRTVGVLRRSHFAEMFPDFAANLRCTDLDGFPVCFARRGGFQPELEYRVAAVGLAEFLAANLDRTLVLAGKDDARSALTNAAVQLLAEQGSRIGQLPTGASYVGILVHGKPVFEQMNPQSAIEVTGLPNSGLGPLKIRKELNVTSSGTAAGAYASLLVDGREVMFNTNGLNVAVLDDNQVVLAVGTFAHPESLPDLAADTGGLVFTLVVEQP